MAILYQKMITSADLIANPEVIYVFGDNVERWGNAGQAKEMRDFKNSFGIATKWEPTISTKAFFKDDQQDRVLKIWKLDFIPITTALSQKKVVIWPTDGIGTGYADLPNKAPLLWSLLEKARKTLELY